MCKTIFSQTSKRQCRKLKRCQTKRILLMPANFAIKPLALLLVRFLTTYASTQRASIAKIVLQTLLTLLS